MKKSGSKPLDFVIDKLTNSIENTSTGEVFDTEIVRLFIKNINQIKKADWQFDWESEIKDKSKEVYKLTTINNPNIIQGLLSIEDKQDHIFMHLIENAKFNKNKNKVKTKYMLGFPETLLLMPARYQLTKVTRDFLPLMLKRH